ncbi:MAG: hypothetical protein GY915_08040, partial [bacterium]|nr:hypothetical protein [bacterium]
CMTIYNLLCDLLKKRLEYLNSRKNATGIEDQIESRTFPQNLKTLRSQPNNEKSLYRLDLATASINKFQAFNQMIYHAFKVGYQEGFSPETKELICASPMLWDILLDQTKDFSHPDAAIYTDKKTPRYFKNKLDCDYYQGCIEEVSPQPNIDRNAYDSPESIRRNTYYRLPNPRVRRKCRKANLDLPILAWLEDLTVYNSIISPTPEKKKRKRRNRKKKKVTIILEAQTSSTIDTDLALSNSDEEDIKEDSPLLSPLMTEPALIPPEEIEADIASNAS